MLHTLPNDSPSPTGEQEMSVHPTMAPFLAPFAPADSSVHADALEAERIESDLKRNADKNSGALLRDEVDRAHQAEVAAGVHQ